jgi:hypothetical protein
MTSPELRQQAFDLTSHEFLVIPLHDGKPTQKYSHRRKRLASDKEINEWFSDTSNADGIAIAINDTEFSIDTDGEHCESMFINQGVPHLSQDLQDLVKSTMHTKSPNGHHRTFRIGVKDFPDGIKTEKYITGKEHNEIAVMGKEHILRERSAKHVVINDADKLVTLSKEQVNELFNMLRKLKELDAIMKVADLLLPYYYQPHRDNIVFAYSGYLHKNKTPLATTEDIYLRLAGLTNYYDEDTEKSLKVIRDKYARDPNTEKVSGYQHFLKALDEAYPHGGKVGNGNGNGNGVLSPTETINQIQAALSKAGLISVYARNAADASTNTDDNGIPASLLNEPGVTDELNKHEYYACIRRYKPVRFVIAHKDDKQIVTAIVNYEERKTGTDANGKEIINKIATLAITDNIINAIPIEVWINNNPLTMAREYKVKFVSQSSVKPIMIGPYPNIEGILEELSSRNLIIKQTSALDALRSIIYRFEVLERATITEEVQSPGFYLNDGQIIGYGIFQKPFDINSPDTMQKVNECIDVIDILYNDFHKPKGKNHTDRLASTLLWGSVAPFSYIKKEFNSKNMEYIERYPFEYGAPDSGKTGSVLPIFGMWNIHRLDVIDRFQHSYTSANTEARLGHILSLTTYPQILDEVDISLGDRWHTNLVNMLKASIIQKISRTIQNKSRNMPSIPYYALSPLILISNDPPPKDSAFRKRIMPLEHLETDRIRDPKEMQRFDKWFVIDDNISKLTILGDFIWHYIQNHPEGADFIIKRPWIEIAHELFDEFYKLVGKEVPSWIKDHEIKTSQEAMQEVGRLNRHQLIAFFQSIIDTAFHDSIYRGNTSDLKQTLAMRLNHCLDNDLIQFIRLYDVKGKGSKLVIKHGFVFAMTEWIARKSSTAVNIELNSLTEYLQGFTYTGIPTTKGSDQRDRVVMGDKQEFINFVDDNLELNNVVEEEGINEKL